MIAFKPFFGLANRMRAVNSAVALSRALNSKIRIIWVKDKGLNAKFTDLFEIPNDKNIELVQPSCGFYNLPYSMRYPLYMNSIKNLLKLRYCKVLILNQLSIEKINPATLKNFDKIFITSYSSDFYDSEFDSELFKPLPKLLNEINSISDNFSVNTYGIHIRRGNNKESSLFSPTELFEIKIENIISLENDALFYLASDSAEVKDRIIKKFGSRIITQNFDTSRNKLEGIESAVIEMFVLAATKKIIGSYWSSYSEVAAMLGRVELEQLKL